MSVFVVCLVLGPLLGLSGAKEATTEITECGVSNLNTMGIQSGSSEWKTAKPGDFPWHVGIYHKDNDGNWEQHCGGTLISARHILTAGHCVVMNCIACKPPPRAVEDMMVALGTTHRNWNTTEGTKRKITKIQVHPIYYGLPFNYANDIAVLELESEVVFDRDTLPACLDLGQKHLEQLTNNKELLGHVSGWDTTRDCPPGKTCDPSSEELKFTAMTIMGLDECFNRTQSAKPSFLSRLTSDKYCTNNGSELRQRSGSGMTLEFSGHHFVYGVASVKLKLQLGEKIFYDYGGFTNVSYHSDWLSNVMQ